MKQIAKVRFFSEITKQKRINIFAKKYFHFPLVIPKIITTFAPHFDVINPVTVDEEKLPLAERIKALKDRRAELEAENASLKAQIDELQQKYALIRHENGELRANYNRLKLAKAYGWDEKSKRAATLRINNIVHEIDSCLALLRQDINL